jgi:hypothetical protein
MTDARVIIQQLITSMTTTYMSEHETTAVLTMASKSHKMLDIYIDNSLER